MRNSVRPGPQDLRPRGARAADRWSTRRVGLELKAPATGARDWVDSPERVSQRARGRFRRRERGRRGRSRSTPGCGLGEIQALRWRDVDFDRGVIMRRALVGPEGRADRAEEPGRARRRVPMTMLVRRELRDLQRRSGRVAATRSCSAARPELAFVPQVAPPADTKSAWLSRGLIGRVGRRTE